MKTLAEILFDAINADSAIMESVGGRVVSTCFEVPPDELDNTQLPNIIISNDGFTNNSTTKDCVWESDEDVVQATVDVAAKSPHEVDTLVAQVRSAIDRYITTLYLNGERTPDLQPNFPTSNGVQWGWMKPCYYQQISYQCVMQKFTDDE